MNAPSPVTVRVATREDARTIARIRVDTWRAAYAGLIAREVLDALDTEAEADRRHAHWDEHHADPRAAELIAEVDGVPAGWAAFGPSQDSDRSRSGQVFAVYALPEHWSTGVGHALIREVEARLAAAGYRTAHLYVLDGNSRAAAFYERHGWREDGTVVTDERVIGGHTAFVLLERRRVRVLAEPLPQTHRGSDPADGADAAGSAPG